MMNRVEITPMLTAEYKKFPVPQKNVGVHRERKQSKDRLRAAVIGASKKDSAASVCVSQIVLAVAVR